MEAASFRCADGQISTPNTMATTVTVKNAVNTEISSTSMRCTGASNVTKNTSLEIEKYSAPMYTKALKTAGKILLVAMIATPFTLMIDSLALANVLPPNQIIIAAIKLVVIGISHWAVMSFMGDSFGCKCENLNGKPKESPAHTGAA